IGLFLGSPARFGESDPSAEHERNTVTVSSRQLVLTRWSEMRILLTAVAIAALCACSRGKLPTAEQAFGPPPTAPQPAPASAEQQLAAFRLQTACAREAHAWLNERERNEGYNPDASGGLLITVNLLTTHYSLGKRACYAVVDQQTTVSGSRVFSFGDERIAIR